MSKVPLLDFNMRQSRSQGGLRGYEQVRGYPQFARKDNPITHADQENLQSFQGSGNLWYHQREQKEADRRRQRVFLEGLNEQRKLEKQRKEIDKKFETLNEYKIQMAKNARIVKEDKEREEYRRRLEEASKRNDMRINHYLSNYYVPPEEKDLRNNVTSDRMKVGSNGRRKIKIMKKRKVGNISNDSINNHNNHDHIEQEMYGENPDNEQYY